MYWCGYVVDLDCIREEFLGVCDQPLLEDTPNGRDPPKWGQRMHTPVFARSQFRIGTYATSFRYIHSIGFDAYFLFSGNQPSNLC